MTDDCLVCGHHYLDRHVEDHRWVATDDEHRRRRCNDCVDCNPPDDATIHENTRGQVPA